MQTIQSKPRWGKKDGNNNAAPPAAGSQNNRVAEVESEAFTKSVTDGVQKIVDEALKKAGLDGKALKPEDITKAVADALKAQREADDAAKAKADAEAKAAAGAQAPNDSKALTAEQVQAAVKAASEAVLSKAHKPDRMVWGDGNEDRSQIEIPFRLVKGNLPLHYKQLLNLIQNKHMNDGISDSQLVEGIKLGDHVLDRVMKAGVGYKALTSTGTNAGDEWVPTDLAAELQRRFYMESVLASLMMAREINMPSDPYKWPLKTTRASWYRNATENSATTASNFATDAITLTTAKCMAETDVSYEVEEDSIIAILPQVVQDLSETGAANWESMLLNGDTTATHMDSDTEVLTAATCPERAFKGFRKLANAASLQVSFASGGISVANIKALLKMLGKWGMNVNNVVMIAGVKAYWDIMGVTESLTQDKAGAAATYQTGQLPRPFGIRGLINSASCREDLNASAVYDGSTVTKGSIIVFNINEFLVGRRRDMLIETDRVKTTQTTKIIASYRRAFVPKEVPSSTIKTVAIAYNYDA